MTCCVGVATERMFLIILLSCIDPLVTTRTSRFTRGHTRYTGLSGNIMLPNAFQSILTKGVQVSEQQEFRQSFNKERDSRSQLAHVQVPILAYWGDLLDPR
ncbi:hypothetical protein HD554DRAFT_2059608 [Boletus coccyginus]|nr:hypothetical protein HD554DRAFT_2059608 [Boletus coccyginus]